MTSKIIQRVLILVFGGSNGTRSSRKHFGRKRCIFEDDLYAIFSGFCQNDAQVWNFCSFCEGVQGVAEAKASSILLPTSSEESLQENFTSRESLKGTPSFREGSSETDPPLETPAFATRCPRQHDPAAVRKKRLCCSGFIAFWASIKPFSTILDPSCFYS